MFRRGRDRTDRAPAGRAPALAVAAIRVGLGAGMLARPALLPKVTGSDQPTAERVSWLVRMLGGREVALGLGALASGGHPGWVAAGLLSDAGDAGTLLLAARAGSLSPLLAAAGSVTSVTAVAVAARELVKNARR